MENIQIAIDGPAGSGKSTLAKALAKRIGIFYLDTGAMYRAMALKALRKGRSLGDPEGLARLINETELTVRCKEDGTHVFIDNEDVTDVIRTPEVSRAVSVVSAVPEIRDFLRATQQAIASDNSVVMDGRDIGTVVLPDAQLKLYVTAKDEVRAQRRMREYVERGEAPVYEEVLRDIRARDEQDSTRNVAPMKKAADAIELDTSEMTPEESVDAILVLIERVQKKR